MTIGLALAASTLLPLRPDYLPIRADEITPERIQLYEAFTTNIGTTIRAEYLPRTTIPRPYTGPALIDPTALPRAIPVRGEAAARQTAKGPISQSWSVRADGDATLAFPTLYFPGWRVSLDGQSVEARATADVGYIEVDVPAGEHTLALWFDRTPLRAGAEIVSMASILFTLGLLAIRRRMTSGNRRTTFAVHLWSFVSARRYEVALLALAAVFAAVASAANAVEARDDNLTMDFESKPWLHHDAAPLTRYEVARSLTPGAPFDVALEWANPANDAIATVQLVAPSSHVFGGPEPLASAGALTQEGIQAYTVDVPPALSKDMYYLQVEESSAAGASRATFLRPIFYGGRSAASTARGWGRIDDAIELTAVHLKNDSSDRLTVAFDWAALKPIAANYALSLRLQDDSGRVWVSLDTQPGYGFLPTSAWLPGELQHDVYTLALPPDIPRDDVYSLDAVWYRAATQQEIGRVRVPGIKIDASYSETEVSPPPRSFDIPSMQHRIDATFGDVIQLLGYDISQSGNRLSLTLQWQALADIGTDYKFFVHVFDPATERIAAQVDAMPGGDAYPTSRWVKDEVVTERLEIVVAAPGVYRVATGWYDPASADRLPALEAQGHPLSSDRAIIGEEITVR